MQISISGHHVEVTDSMREYVTTKIERLEKHFDHITSAKITLTVEKLRQRAEGSIHVSGNELHASAESEDMYAAIDTLTDKT